MGTDNPALMVALIAAAVSAFTAILTYRSSTRANSANDRKVDLEEHRDSIERLRKIIEEQDKHVERFRTQLERVQDQLAREQDVSATLRNEIRTLRDQVDELSRSRTRLEEVLAVGQSRRREGRPVPPTGGST